MWQFGPFTRYSWGWDLRLPFGWWLVYSRAERKHHLYVSDDATPPCDDNCGLTLFSRFH